MSKTSITSKTSLRSYGRRKRGHEDIPNNLKPFGFCCSVTHFDPLTKYAKDIPPLFGSTLTPIKSLEESPTLKLQTQITESLGSIQRKKKFSENAENLVEDKKRLTKIRGLSSSNEPVRWYLEDELTYAKNSHWKEKQDAYNYEMDTNTAIGKKKIIEEMKTRADTEYPKWYQEFSFDQMRNLLKLERVIREDYEEMVTERTQRTLLAIGVMSTFFRISPPILRKLQKICNHNPIEFLREIYKILTGNDFETEDYKNFYDCNERIILSGIAFLTLPETVVELHKRMSPVTYPVRREKPQPPIVPFRRRMDCPYQEKLFLRPDWASYCNNLQSWRAHCKLLPIPKIILPNPNLLRISRTSEEIKYAVEKPLESENTISTSIGNATFAKNSVVDGKSTVLTKKQPETEEAVLEKATNSRNTDPVEFEIPRLPDENKVFDFTINGVGPKSGPVEYKICGVLSPTQIKTKSWLGEKRPHYVIAGASDNPPTCPVTYEVTGVANVTPTNSDERFFTVLKLGDGPKKIYPSGRKNLSKNWQEWLENADEEFSKVEKEANKLIKSVEATMRLVFPGPKCDSCCPCRQTRKSHIKWKDTKAPYFVIDSVAEDTDKNKYIVGSMAMHSPAPSPPESTVNLLEVIASEEKITTNLLINGVTNDKGETQYYISGIQKDIVHIPSRTVAQTSTLKPVKNVPPCACAIHQIFDKDLSPTMSSDNIPWTKDEGICCGKKYRPTEIPAYSCKMHPGDKSCRRNPFRKDIEKLKQKRESEERNIQEDSSPRTNKKMYSMADFQPCGDEHGSAVCTGPWGTLNIYTPEELAEEDRIRKEILRGPPCGTKPGRAICEGPFGAKIPIEKKVKAKDEDEEEEDEEEEQEEEEEKGKIQETPIELVKERVKIRDNRCFMSPESIAGRQKVAGKKTRRFISDPNYPAYDDPWNLARTAPTEEETETDYEKTMKLSLPQKRIMPPEEGFDDNLEDANWRKTKVKREVPSKSKRQSKTTVEKIKSSSTVFTESTSKVATKTDSLVKQKKKKNGTVADDVRTSAMTKTDQSEVLLKKVHGNVPRSVSKIKEKASSGLIKKKFAKSEGKTETPSGSKNLEIKRKVVGKQKTGINRITSKKVSSLRKQGEKIKDNSKAIRSKAKLKTQSADQLKKASQDALTKGRKRKQKDSMEDDPSIIPRTKSKGFKSSSSKDKVSKRDKKKEGFSKTIEPKEFRRKEIDRLKSMMFDPQSCPIDVQPIILPENPPITCGHLIRNKEETEDHLQPSFESKENFPQKGPCGWRTKSEQNLPVKKNLAYLTERQDPLETVSVRPGGKPCTCRELRSKKKILYYNIGGNLDKNETNGGKMKLSKRKKEGELNENTTRVIEGVTYYTPPPSPRRSDEYVPEYDLYQSPYDKCVSKQVDRNLKLIEQTSGPKSLLRNAINKVEPCGCGDDVDIPDKENVMLEIARTKEDLITGKSGEEHWEKATKDPGLIDHFTQDQHSLPCWLKCAKFRKEGSGSSKRLKIKRPVCECKNERRVLEHREGKINWKNRQQKLKSFKKQPIMSVVDISRPLESDMKLMISGVKRIPQEHEYIDDIKYCITGVAENSRMAPPNRVVDGVKMLTPLQTPNTSKERIATLLMQQKQPKINIPPGPLPRKDAALIEEKKRRQQVLEEAYRQIYEPVHTKDQDQKFSCQKDYPAEDKLMPKQEEETMMLKEETSSSAVKYQRELSMKLVPDAKRDIQKKTKMAQVLDNFESEKSEEKEKNVVKEVNGQTVTEEEDIFANRNVMSLVEAELDKMAKEGFVFAKLPKCIYVPQLQDWLRLRKGVAYSENDKAILMRDTRLVWNRLNCQKGYRIKAPPLSVTKEQLKRLTYDSAKRLKKEIAEKKALYHSNVRKARVQFARSMWSSMQYGKFPSHSFKTAYFTYLAGKENDGHIFRPWYRSEVCDMQQS